MKFFKRAVLIVIIFLALTQLSQSNRNQIVNTAKRWINSSFCDRSIQYKLGSIGTEFSVSKEDFEKAAAEASKIWNDQYKKEIFTLKDGGSLEINLVYDGRQKLVTKINTLDEAVSTQKVQLDQKNAAIDQTKNLLETEVENLNKKIDYWNAKGGAPEKEYSDLVKKQSELEGKIAELNKQVENINSQVDKINSQVNDLNTNVGAFNSVLKINPEVGTYTSRINKIDIFFFASHEELVHVLAHEMGHALGLAHVNENDAIMNPTISSNVKLTSQDIEELNNFCTNKNRLDLIKNDVANYLYTISSNLQKYL